MDLERDQEQESVVEFSVDKIRLVNDGRGRQKATYYVQNRCSISRKVRVAVERGSDPVFRLLSGYGERCLAAGLKLPVVLQYTPGGGEAVGSHHGRLNVFVEDKLAVSVPMEALPPSPYLEASPHTVDFGNQVAEHQIVSQTFTVSNTGSREGGFQVHSPSLPPHLTITPMEGRIKPGERMELKVELLSKEIGMFSQEVSLLSEDGSVELFTVKMCGKIQHRRLELLDPNDPHSTLQCIPFGHTYYGTVLTKQGILYNNSPVVTEFMAVLDSEGVGGMVRGVDRREGLAMACTGGGLGQDQWREQGGAPSGEELITVTPMQGSLGPYEKHAVEFSFTPSFLESGVGWTHLQGLPAERSYALFVKFVHVRVHPLRGREGEGGGTLEVAVTGTVVPVNLSVEPGTTLDFGECPAGSTNTQQIQLCNRSDVLPIEFCCQKLAHYKCSPSAGKIPPGKVVEMSVTFLPKQLGPLNFKLQIDVMGPVKDASSSSSRKAVVYTAVVELKGSGAVGGRRRERKREEVAHPSDLATSIRPHDGKTVIVTPYTRISRHTYVDPDYTHPEEERAQHKRHRDSYIQYIRQKHEERMWRRREKGHSDPAYRNTTDLAIPPAQGLHPPKLTTPKDPSGAVKGKSGQPSLHTGVGGEGSTEGRMLTTRDLVEATAAKLQVVEQCASKPSSPEATTDCRAHLSLEQLSQVVIGPLCLDFGRVAVRSTVERHVSVQNFLSKHITIRMKVAGTELRCPSYPTSPSSHLTLVLPPLSHTQVPFTLQQNTIGTLERSLEYCINGHHAHHIPVKAEVVKLTLKLSTNTLTLSEPYLSAPTAGLHGSVLVTNEHSVPAHFQWHAREGVETDTFFVMHPTGVVPPHSSLECEFVCQPTFTSANTAQFMLGIEEEGREESEREPQASNMLSLVAQFGQPSCCFREKRMLFGTIPLNLTTTRTLHLENTGDCHAYFKVVDPSPYPGMQLFPKSGCVPVGGAAELQVVLHPQTVDRFDVRVAVEVREGRRTGVRIAGAIEHPTVAIDKELFRFGGVYCGATATIPFTVTNKATSRAQLTFDLSFMSDFFLVLPSQEGPYGEVISDLPTEDYPGVYSLELPGKTSVECMLQFCPNNVAAYDFHLPILVNGQKPPSPPPSPWPPSRAPSKVTITQGSSTVSFGHTPTRRVLATALRPPLLVSPTELRFTIQAGYLETTTEPTQHNQVIKLTNVGEEPLTWALDYTGVERLEDGTFKFVHPIGTPLTPPTPTSSQPTEGEIGFLKPGRSFEFTVQCKPAHHGSFSASVPLIVNGNLAYPYRTLSLTAEVPTGRITVSPSHIVVQPVPLGVTLTAQFMVSVQGFSRPVNLEVSLPTMEDHVDFTAHFPQGCQAVNCLKEKVDLPCTLEFSSSQPVSRMDYITFSDKTTGKRKRVPFTVAADNCIFTVYEFLAQNLNSILIKGGEGQAPILVLKRLAKGLPHTSSESSVSLSSRGDGGVSLTASSTFGGMFLQDCVYAMCRWLSVYGWAGGVKCVVTPVDLRNKVGHDVPKTGVKQRSSLKVSRGMLLDLLTHICDRLPPGVPLNPHPCTTPSEKVNQQYSGFATVLAFIKSQGGLLWSVVPELLLDYQDYQQWLKDGGGVAGSAFHPESEEEFLEASRQAWTHLLMQIIKVLILPRIISHVPRPLQEQVSEMAPLESNVYSRAERTLLAWLNHHQHQQRRNIFSGQDLLEREIMNFDVDLMDCTVLACTMAAYCPYLVSSHFVRLFAEPSSPEQCSHNAVVLVEALRDVGLDYDCQPSDLCSPNPVFMLLFCYHLYHHLPAFRPAPKSTITLEGTLHSTVAQQVQLQNPNTKPLVYRALIRGENAEDFSIAEEKATIILPGRQHTTVEVRFSARRLLPSSAILLLVARGGTATGGTTLAFTLQATVTGANPQSSTSITAALYEPQEMVLEVTSPFPEAGEFKVQLYETGDKRLLSTLSPKSRRKYGGLRPPVTILTSSMQERSTDRMRLFHSVKNTVHLQPVQPAPVKIQFTPLKMEPRYCAIVLSSTKLGDIVLSIASTVKLPRPILPHSQFSNPHTVVNKQTRTVHLKAHAGQTVEEGIVVFSRNPAFEDTMLVISKWDMSDIELKRRHLSESLRCAALSTAVATLDLDDRPKTYRDNITEDDNKLVFSVEGGNEYFSLPEVVAVPADLKGSAVLPVRFHADEEGQYECHVVLQSEHDIRVVVIESTVLAQGRHAELEFKTPAMQPLMQEIPLVNPSTVDWPLEAALSGTGFTGPETIVVKALTTTCYPLTFHPRKEGMVEGVLHLVNTSDGMEHTFQLRGVAERPLAQGYITLHAHAKRSLTHILHVPNHNERTTMFRVESDLDFISGPSTTTIGGGDIVDYPLTVLPRRQGTFSGAVAFVAQAVDTPHSFEETLTTPTPEGAPQHIWFHIDCRVDPAPPDHVIPVSCPTLSSTTLHLTVVNPYPQPLTLEVLVEGRGLSGPDRLEVEPCGEVSYPLTFTPTTAGKTEGRVVFNGSPDGEFWYLLHLNALNPKPVVLPDTQCELGRTSQELLCLSNPLDHPVTFSCQCTNTRHFIVTGLSEGQVLVDPGSSIEVPVLFKPSALGAGEHTAEVSFTSQEFGEQIFTLNGRGLPPTAMDPTTITASLSSNTVHILTFINPLDTPSYYSVSLQGADLEHFCLLMKRTKAILLHPGVSLDIPVMFAPESMYRHQVTVVVSTETRDSDQSRLQTPTLSWQYPFIGQPELRPFTPTSAPKLSCCAKERLEQRLEVSLVTSTSSQVAHLRPLTPGSKPRTPESQESEEETYKYKLVCDDRRYSPLVEQSIGIKLLRKIVKEDDPCAATLVFSIVFVPPKVFSCMSELQVTSSQGGVWRFLLHLAATPAAPDDVITVEAQGLNQETQVGFRLTSMAEHPVSFTAHLVAGSDRELSVHPTSGELAPINTNGTLFCVTYRPTTYGRDHHARLIVQSDSSEWCYKIVGKPPSYTPPTHTSSRVQHKAAPPLLRVPQQKKNFVRENMRLSTRIGVN